MNQDRKETHRKCKMKLNQMELQVLVVEANKNIDELTAEKSPYGKMPRQKAKNKSKTGLQNLNK